MTAPSYVVFEGDGGSNTPRRPTTDDLGGLLLQDSVKYPPRPDEHISSLDWKQMEQCLVRLARMVPMLQIQITCTAGEPVVDSVWSVNDSIVVSDITASSAPAAGGLFILVPSAKLPPKTRPASIEIAASTVDDMSVHIVSQIGGTVLAKIVKPSDGTGLDGSGTFLINVYGV